MLKELLRKVIKAAVFLLACHIFLYFPRKFMKRTREFLIKLTNIAPNEFIIQKGDTVCLVGSPPGGEYLRMAKLVGKRGQVIVIEPEKGNLEKLRGEIKKEGITNVKIIPKGAYSKKGRQTLFVSDRPADHKIEISDIMHDNDLRQGAYISAEEIETDTLDNILNEIAVGHVDFVKITVNGAELEVLKGMEETLKGDVKLYVKGCALKDGEPINRIIASFLKNRGFITNVLSEGTSPVSDDFVRAGDIYAHPQKARN